MPPTTTPNRAEPPVPPGAAQMHRRYAHNALAGRVRVWHNPALSAQALTGR